MRPKINVPPRLKLAFGDMCQMGKDYTTSKKSSASEILNEIEAA